MIGYARDVRGSDVIACEDTRRTRILLSRFDIPRPKHVLSYRQQTEHQAGERIMRFLKDGKTVALCSDGGYPGVSDPGYRLISLAIERGVEFDVIPGPSAVTIALLRSGLPSS